MKTTSKRLFFVLVVLFFSGCTIAAMVVLFPVTFTHEQSAEMVDALFEEGLQFYSKENFRQAAQKLEEALEIARSIGDKGKIGEILTYLAIACTRLGDNAKAIPYFEQALKIYREIGNNEYMGINYMHLGAACLELGDYPKAISSYEHALKLHRETGKEEVIKGDLLVLGEVYKRLGHYAKAISYFEQALKIHKESEDNMGKYLMAEDHIFIGSLYLYLGDCMKAISYFERAIEISRELMSNNEKEGAEFTLLWLGFVYALAGDNTKAISYYENALKFLRKMGYEEEFATALLYCGILYAFLGNNDKATSYFEQAKKVYRDNGIPTEEAEVNIADVWFEMGEFDKAEETYLKLGDPGRLGNLHLVKRNYQKAIKLFEKLLNEDLQKGEAEPIFTDCVLLGQAYEGLKDYGKAREYYKKAIFSVEEQREALTGAEKGVSNSLGELTTKFFVAKKRILPYEGIVRVLIAMDNPKEAFFYSENLKARVLAEAIARGQSALEYGLPSRVAEEENFYITEIGGLRKQMEALYKNKAMDTYYEREKELKTVKAKQKEFIRRLRESYPEYASIHYPQPIKPDEVVLKSGEVLIEFEVTDNETYVFMLKEGKLKTKEVSISREELHELVLQYRGFFEGITKTSQLLQYSPEVGEKLYSLLLGDILKPLAEGTTLIIVPDEFLGILPFEALVTDLSAVEKIGEGQYGPFPLGVKYLGDKYSVSYAQSATSLSLLRSLKKGRGEGENILVVADPIFSANDARQEALTHADFSEDTINVMGAIADWKEMGVKGVRLREEKRDVSTVADELFPRLAKTEALAGEIEEMFGNKAMVYLGSDAREDKIAQISFQDYRYLIFATHGILDNTVPWIQEPALVLSQVGNPEDYDGFLTMSEVMGLKLDAEVIALTACETGVGKNVSGEGVMGMGRVFQYAGAKNVLVSLWSVAETSATELTSAFFKYIKEGKEPKESVRLARSEIRRKGYEHPFYWAGFILFGK